MTDSMEVRKAFAMALSEMPDMYTDTTANAGRRGNYKYMQLPTMLTIIKPILNRHSLVMYQYVERDADGAGVVTCFTHKETGDTLCLGSYPLTVSSDPQAQGSALTYARRYSLMTALGVMPDKDDDGAAAQAAALRPAPAATQDGITRDEYTDLVNRIIIALGVAETEIMPWLSTVLGRPINRGSQLTQTDAANIRAMLDTQTQGGAA